MKTDNRGSERSHDLRNARVERGCVILGCVGEHRDARLGVVREWPLQQRRERDEIDLVTCRHEGSASLAAVADAKLTGRAGVVMVSRGDPERNRAKIAEHGLTFPVVLQEQWQLSRQYAKFATPIAYLIDTEGRIAATVAMGVDAILALASPEPAAVGARS